MKRHVGNKDATAMRIFDAYVSADRHIRRYLDAYLPDAGFEYAVTHRYDAMRQSIAGVVTARTELCLLAVHDIRESELVPHCRAALRDLSPVEDEALRDEAHRARVGAANGERVVPRDFSIIRPSSRGCSQLLLGPARFINHDCRPNSEFRRTGHQITIRAIRPIARGDEITVYYGDNYFEMGNSECMCETCERRGTGIFTSPRDDSDEHVSEAPADGPRRTRSRSTMASPPPVPLSVPPGAGPECTCATCEAKFRAPEKWWTPDECPRCERHYKIFKRDWPHRGDTDGRAARRKPSAREVRESSESSLSSDESPRRKTPPPRKTVRKALTRKAPRHTRSSSPRPRSRFEVRSDESDEDFEKNRMSLGPKILGQGARTEVLASYWGAPDGGLRKRRRTETTAVAHEEREHPKQQQDQGSSDADSAELSGSSSSASGDTQIATKGKERTSDLNLARFWSAGVVGRTRQQARRPHSEHSVPESTNTPPLRGSPRVTPSTSRASSRHVSVDIKAEREDTPRHTKPDARTEREPNMPQAGENMEHHSGPEKRERTSSARDLAAAAQNASMLPNGHADTHTGIPRPTGNPATTAPMAAPSGSPGPAIPTHAGQPAISGTVPNNSEPRRVRRNLRWGSGKVSYSRPLPQVKHENM